jgi:hypothetical protein
MDKCIKDGKTDTDISSNLGTIGFSVGFMTHAEFADLPAHRDNG